MSNNKINDLLEIKSFADSTNQLYKSIILKNTGLVALSLTTSSSFAMTPVSDITQPKDKINTVYNKHNKQQELLIIDSRVNNIGDLINRRRLGLIPIVVKRFEDGLDVLSQAMLDYPDAQAIHVVSHGNSGQILLGKNPIDEAVLNTRTGAKHQWQGKDRKRPDLIIYGCDVAKGQKGLRFINELSAYTGFDVAASTDLTGQASLGGDWVLEANTGWIDASLAWQADDITQIQGVLATITVNSLLDNGAGTLRDALATVVNGDIINFSVSGTITLSSGQLVIANDVTITGPGSANLTIDANNASRVINISGNRTVSIAGVTITGGSVAGGAGIAATASNTSLSLDDVTITNNNATSKGGGIYIDGNYMTLNIVNSTISNNSASSSGGGIRFGNDSGYLSIDNSLITANTAGSQGGGIYIYVKYDNPTVAITNSTISNNTSTFSRGGGVSFYSYKEYDIAGGFTLDNVIVTGNQASLSGGGLYFKADYNLIPISINNSTISNNTSGNKGGGLLVRDDYGDTDLTISNTTISNNTSINSGGGAYIYKDSGGGITTIVNSTISGNTSTTSRGGGLTFSHSRNDANIINSTITNNSSNNNGGGFRLGFRGITSIENTIISGNTSTLNTSNDAYSYSASLTLNLTNSLIGDSAGLNTFTNVGGNLLNTNPLLTALQNNGGLTQTHQLSFGSPAINAGSNALNTQTFDQRGTGFPRILNTTIDMGAVEGAISLVTLSLSGSPMLENAGVATITATADVASPNPITIDLAFTGTASGTDYSTSASQIVIPAGATTASMTLTAIDDINDEPDETIIVDIVAVTGGAESGVQQVTATITDDDVQEVTLAVTGSPLAENAGVANVTATLNAVSSFNVTVDLGFTGSATNAVDFTPSATQLIIPAGTTSLGMTLTGIDDLIDEIDESIIVDITTVTNGVEAGGMQQVSASITDDDAPANASLSLTGSPLAENGGVATVTATLDTVTSFNTVIDLGFTGSAINATDFSPSAASLTIPAGSLTNNITLTAIDDLIDELDETVIVDITAISGSVEAGGMQQVTATITDDDAPANVSLSLTGSPLAENGGVATVTATLDTVTSFNTVIDLAFTGTATNGTDFSPSSAQMTIPAGSLTSSITLTGIDDINDELDETIIVDISAVSGSVEMGVQQVTAVITDDDVQQVSLALTGSPFAENAGVANVTATLNAVSSFNVTVDLGFTGTATNGVDYTPSATQLIIPAGTTSLGMSLTGIDDLILDPNEAVIVDIVGVTNGVETGGMQQVTATITDDEVSPQATFSLSATLVPETVGMVTYSVTLDIPAPVGGVTIDLSFSGTATNPNDYTPSGSQIVIPAGSTTGSIIFTIIDDAIPEVSETIIIDIANITNAVINGPSTAVLIINAQPFMVPILSRWSLLLLGMILPAFAMKWIRERKKIDLKQ